MKKNIFKTLVLGTAVGGALGVLFAPKSGKETRQDIRRAYRDVSADVSKRAKEAGNLTKERYDELVDKAVSEYKRVKEMSNEQISTLKQQLKERWNESNESSEETNGEEAQQTQAKKTSRSRSSKNSSSAEQE
jgi:gas vesicle protein